MINWHDWTLGYWVTNKKFEWGNREFNVLARTSNRCCSCWCRLEASNLKYNIGFTHYATNHYHLLMSPLVEDNAISPIITRRRTFAAVAWSKTMQSHPVRHISYWCRLVAGNAMSSITAHHCLLVSFGPQRLSKLLQFLCEPIVLS